MEEPIQSDDPLPSENEKTSEDTNCEEQRAPSRGQATQQQLDELEKWAECLKENMKEATVGRENTVWERVL